MRHVALGSSRIRVSAVGLGTMMMGELTSEEDAHRQLSLAADRGVNLIDTAEMYPVPLRPRTKGLTEEIVGRWLKATGLRDRVVLSTKIVGPPPREVVGPTATLAYIRNGETHLGRANIRAGIEGSLRRLATDYIDLFQPHWPDRSTNALKELGYVARDDRGAVAIEETLDALDELVREGKVRAIGVSNETPWGVSKYLHASETTGKARIVSIQNAYNLLCRSFEVGLAEFSHREDVGLLAYSPLGMGVLTGKYLKGARPQNARLSLYPHPRYTHPSAVAATQAYKAIAEEHGLDLRTLALAFVASRPFVVSTLIGASHVGQLDEDIAACGVSLSAEVMERIEAVHRANSNPGP